MIGQPSTLPPTYAPEWALTQSVLRRRVAAWLVDAALIAVICAVLWVVFAVLGVLTLGLGFVLFGVLPAVPVLYHWLFVAGPGAATPGQALLGLVVRRDEDLGPVGSLQALVSSIGLYVTLATGAIWLLAALVTTHKRTLHDIVSGTVVVRAQALTSPPGAWNMAV